jgi:hypothetical protein
MREPKILRERRFQNKLTETERIGRRRRKRRSHTVKEDFDMRRTAKPFEGFIGWFVRQPWNLGFELPVHPGITAVKKNRNLSSWLDEMEKADGSLRFSYAHFDMDDTNESYVFVGGINTEDWWHWAARWAAINGDADNRDAFAWFLYSRRRQGMRIREVVDECLKGGNIPCK